MKKILVLTVVLMLLASAALADCWYYYQYGKHDFQQTDFAYTTCETDGYYVLECLQCGYNEKHITDKAYGHKWTMENEVQPTCTKQGYRSYYCEECHKTDVKPIEAKGHTWESVGVVEKATCTKEGTEHVVCKECGKEDSRPIPKTKHSYGSWSDSIPATDHSMGTRFRKCALCDKTETEKYYPDGTLMRDSARSDAAKELQQQLIDLEYLNDKADGIFGKKTEQAVKDYQRAAGFEVTGIAYPQTRNAIRSDWNSYMGVNPDPITELDPDSGLAIEASDGEYPPCCEHELDANGSGTIRLCENHDRLLSAGTVLLSYADGDQQIADSWKKIREMWNDELNRLYAVWMEAADPEDVPTVASTQTMFTVYLNMQEGMWKTQATEAWTADQKAVSLIVAQCADVCAAVYALGGE